MRRLVGLFLFAGLCFGQMPPPGGTPETCEDGTLGVAIWPRDAQAASKIGKEKLVDILRHCEIGRVETEQDVRDYRFVSLEKGRLYLVAIIPSGGTIGDILAIVNCDFGSCVSHLISYGLEKDLKKDLVSLSGDGVYQIVSWRLLTCWPPFLAVPYIHDIGDNRRLRDASRKYSRWYTRHLYPELRKQHRWAQVNVPGNPFPRSKAALADDTAASGYALADYRERVLGIRDARLQQAIVWARTGRVPQFAFDALREGGDSPRTTQLLHLLEKSKSADVRKEVEEFKAQRQQN